MIRPGSALVRGKPKKAIAPAVVAPGKKVEQQKPELEEFLEKQDYKGAVTLLEFERKAREERPNALLWLSYCAFHLGEYRKAIDAYDELLRNSLWVSGNPQHAKELHVFKACCLYALYMYTEAEQEALKADSSVRANVAALQNRLLFHIAHKHNDEKKMVEYHAKLRDTTEDQLCLAAIQYLRNHYQEATDIYKRLLIENREHAALNCYIAMCYYKLDYYDVAMDILQPYLQTNPNSITAVNLKACAHHQLYNGKAAEAELKVLQNAATSGNVFQEHDLLRHNMVVFRNGENAPQVLPPLVDLVPEARLNQVIYHLRHEEFKEAHALIKDMEPSVPREYILKGVVFAALGQKTENREHVKMAQTLFQMVGASPSECDTIPGRQCMASCFFLLRQFDEVLVYLRSIKNYFPNDDDFNWNFGVACAAAGEYREAKEALLMIQSEKYRSEFCYVSWLCRCYIMCGEPQLAWETYSRLESSTDSFNLLQLIANDCYRMGHFYWSCKAFDLLERLDPDPEFWDGKRGAAVGVFQKVVANRESPERLQEVVNMLRNTPKPNPQVEYMINVVIKKWAAQSRIKLE